MKTYGGQTDTWRDIENLRSEDRLILQDVVVATGCV